MFLASGRMKKILYCTFEDINADKSPHHLLKPCQIFIGEKRKKYTLNEENKGRF